MKKTIYTEPYRELIAELKRARLALGITQTQAGQAVGMSRNWIHKVEQCELRLDVVQFCRLCGVYAVSAASLVRRIDRETKA